MTAKQRVVGKLPMDRLLNDCGDIAAVRRHDVGMSEIKELLRRGSVQFVVANVGASLRWIPLEEAFSFWAKEVKPRLVEADTDRIYLDDYPDEYGYCASLWQAEEGTSIVLLELQH